MTNFVIECHGLRHSDPCPLLVVCTRIHHRCAWCLALYSQCRGWLTQCQHTAWCLVPGVVQSGWGWLTQCQHTVPNAWCCTVRVGAVDPVSAHCAWCLMPGFVQSGWGWLTQCQHTVWCLMPGVVQSV